MIRPCSKCKQPFEAPYKRKFYCKQCDAEYMRQWRKAHPERKYTRNTPVTPRHAKLQARKPDAGENQDKSMYCLACAEDTLHIQYSVSSRHGAARWQCGQCKRIRPISATELRASGIVV